MPKALWSWAGAALITALYAALLAWFGQVDFYHRHFFDHGALVWCYWQARLLFIPCFAWTVYAAGAGVMALAVGRKALGALPMWERWPLGFIIGAGLWHVLLFPVGLAGWYVRPLAVGLSLGVMALSVPHLATCLRMAASTLRKFHPCRGEALLAAGIVLSAACFLLVKGLYPSGAHDYYNHYFPYRVRVVETGSTLPNDVWYHFYYSKGLALYFIAMLLTDPLAPQLVTTGFIGAGACMVFALLKRGTQARYLPWIGVLLYILFYAYSYGVRGVSGDSGSLEKNHELTAVLLLGMVWIASRLFEPARPLAARVWMLALHMAIITLALITLELVLLAGIYMAAYVLWFWYRRQWPSIRQPFMAGVTSAVAILAMLAVNYHYTGTPVDQLIWLWWPFADLQKVARWGVLFEVIDEYARMKAQVTDAVPWYSPKALLLLAEYLRLELWWPLLLPPLALLARFRHRAAADAATWCALLLFTAAVAVLSLAGGRLAVSSFYRMSSFSYAPMLCISLLLWYVVLQGAPRRRLTAALCMLLVAWLAAIVVIPSPRRNHLPEDIGHTLAGSVAFWSGEYSLKDAYQNQQGRPGRQAWGGIYPGMEAAWRIAGPGTRIRSFHAISYCMLPDCNVQGFKSFRFSPSWQKVYLGTPAEGARALQAEGLNYFFFSKELPDTEDPLPYAPLFSPDRIGRHLAIRWTDGTSYLLTWSGPDTRPIDADFLSAYRHMAQELPQRHVIFPAHEWEMVSRSIAALQGAALHPFCLPWMESCGALKP